MGLNFVIAALGKSSYRCTNPLLSRSNSYSALALTRLALLIQMHQISGMKRSTTTASRPSFRMVQAGRCFATLSPTTERTILGQEMQPTPSKKLSLVCPIPTILKTSLTGISGRLHIWLRPFEQQPWYDWLASRCVSFRRHLYHQFSTAALCWHCLNGKSTEPSCHQG